MAPRKKPARRKRRAPQGPPAEPLPRPAMVPAGASPFAYKPLVFEGPPCRTLDDMTEAEIRAIEERYGMPVRRRDKVS